MESNARPRALGSTQRWYQPIHPSFGYRRQYLPVPNYVFARISRKQIYVCTECCFIDSPANLRQAPRSRASSVLSRRVWSRQVLPWPSTTFCFWRRNHSCHERSRARLVFTYQCEVPDCQCLSATTSSQTHQDTATTQCIHFVSERPTQHGEERKSQAHEQRSL